MKILRPQFPFAPVHGKQEIPKGEQNLGLLPPFIKPSALKVEVSLREKHPSVLVPQQILAPEPWPREFVQRRRRP